MSQIDISVSQLRWRCRRGMLELDLFLNTFLDAEYAQLSDVDISQFVQLLDYPDQHLLDLLLDKTEAADSTISHITARIRQVCRENFSSSEYNSTE